MAVLKMVMANIKHRVGAFYSVVILMAVVSLVLSYTINLDYNSIKSVEDIIEKSSEFNGFWVGMYGLDVGDDVIKNVESLDYVKEVKRLDSFPAIDIHVNGKKTITHMQLTKGGFGEVYFKDNNYTDEKVKVNKGEIYLTYYHKANDGIKIGDKVRIKNSQVKREFVVKGFQSFSFGGSITTGIKPVVISDEDYDEMMECAKKTKEGEAYVLWSSIYAVKTDDCNLSDSEFVRKVNKDTNLNSYTSLSHGGDSCKFISTSVISTLAEIVIAFAAMIIIVVVIVIVNNISSTVDEHYAEYGILKASGFSKGQLRAMFVIQFGLAFIIGTVLGIIASIPVVIKTCGMVERIVGLKVNVEMDIFTVVKLMSVIAVIVLIVIYIATSKIAKVSPIKAITGNNDEIYFDSMIKLPLSKKHLISSLAYRNFVTNKRRYIISTIVVSVIMFFMLSMNGFSHLIESKNVMRNMGFIISDLYVGSTKGLTDEDIKKINEISGDYIKKDETYIYDQNYVSVNGENVTCMIYDKNVGINNMIILKGRAPANDDEIALSKKYAEFMDLKIGDKVRVESFGNSKEYLVTGIFPFATELGKGIAMSKNAAKRIGFSGDLRFMDLTLKDISDLDKVIGMLKKEFNENDYTVTQEDLQAEDYITLINFIKMIILTVSTVLIFIVVNMICKRLFAQEKKDIGIYKSQGFTSASLRKQFVIRFLISCIIGIVIGVVASLMFSEKIMRILMDGVGFGSFVMSYNVGEIMMLVALLMGLFAGCSYFISRKIKKVDIRQLIAE